MKQEIIDLLEKPFAIEDVKARDMGDGTMLDYVPVDKYVKKLNKIFTHEWSFEILEDKAIGDVVWKHGKLTVLPSKARGVSHPIVKTAWGSNELEQSERYFPKIDIGGEVVKQEDGENAVMISKMVATSESSIMSWKGAEGDSLKRCCKQLGIGLHLYDEEDAAERTKKAKEEDKKEVADSNEKPISKKITQTQLNTAKEKLGDKKAHDVFADFCLKEKVEEVGDLSRKAGLAIMKIVAKEIKGKRKGKKRNK